MIRLLLVEDQVIIREGLRRLLDAQEDLQVVGEAGNGQQALETIENLTQDSKAPDVVIMDMQMPIMDGVKATYLICKRFPKIKVLVLTTFDDDEYVRLALKSGAIGYLLKDTPSSELANATRAASKGYAQLSPGLLEKLLEDKPTFQSSQADDHKNILAKLTSREREVLTLIATGASNREIAEVLYITEKTVKNYVTSILSRLNLRGRTQAAVFASSLGLLDVSKK